MPAAGMGISPVLPAAPRSVTTVVPSLCEDLAGLVPAADAGVARRVGLVVGARGSWWR